MLGKIFGLWLSIENPVLRVIVNVSLALIVATFYYLIYAIDTTPVLSMKEKIIKGIQFYGAVVLFAYWQYRKWIKKGKTVVKERNADVTETKLEAKKEKKIDPNNASFKRVNKGFENYIRNVRA